MARLPSDSDKLGPRSTAAATKLEIDDASDDDERPRIKKRSKTTVSNLKYVVGSVLDDPSPLGLRLRKSPSLVDLIQMRLSQANAAAASSFGSLQAGNEKELKSSVISGSTPDKMKASNFPMSLLRIGSWERVSKYEGDLVAKCYFAKHKLVWEVLEGSLKSKIEIQWADITFLKMACAEDGIESLDIVLAKPPLFFRETDPQPRKHTLWQPTQDFTSGQASMFRRHFLQCSYGFLRKNIEKIAHCDPRLNSLWQQQDVTLDPPNLETQLLFFEDQDDSESHDLIEKEYYRNTSSLSNSFFTATSLMSSKNEPRNFVERRLNHALMDSPLPCSGIISSLPTFFLLLVSRKGYLVAGILIQCLSMLYQTMRHLKMVLGIFEMTCSSSPPLMLLLPSQVLTHFAISSRKMQAQTQSRLGTKILVMACNKMLGFKMNLRTMNLLIKSHLSRESNHSGNF